LTSENKKKAKAPKTPKKETPKAEPKKMVLEDMRDAEAVSEEDKEDYENDQAYEEDQDDELGVDLDDTLAAGDELDDEYG